MPRKKKQEENFSDMSVDELQDRWKQIKELLDSLEDDYRNAEISEDAYKEAKEKNTQKFNELTEILKGWGITADQLTAAPEGGEEKKEGGNEGKKGGKPAGDTGKKEKENPPEKPASSGKTEQPEPSGPPAASPAAAGVSMDVIETKIDAKMEKLKANLDVIKETGTAQSERMQMMSESIGELKSQGTHREGVLSDLQSKFDTLEEQLKEINPNKYNKELEKRDKTSEQQDMRLEKLEVKSTQMAQTVGEIKKLLESIGGLENVAAISKEVGKKLEQVNQRFKDLSQLGSKIERMYTDLNKRMEDFAIYKSKQENLEALSKDLVRSVDTISTRMDDYVTLENFDSLKKNISDVDLKISTLKEMIDKLIPIAKMKIPQPIKDLQEEQEAIKTMLQSMDEEYQAGNLEKDKYEAIHKKNAEKLSGIQGRLKSEWQRFERMVTGASKSANIAQSGGSPSGQKTKPAQENPVQQSPKEEGGNETKPAAKPAGKGKPIQPESQKPAETPAEETTSEEATKGKQPAGEEEQVITKKMKHVMNTGSFDGLKKMGKNKEDKPARNDDKKTAGGKKAAPTETRKEGNPKVVAAKTAPVQSKTAGKPKPAKTKAALPAAGKKGTKGKKNTKTTFKTDADPLKKEVAKEKPKQKTEALDKQTMMEALEDSFKKGHISKEAYESTKKILEAV